MVSKLRIMWKQVKSAQNARALQTLRGHTGRVLGLCAFDHGSKLLSCSADGTIRFWDLEEAKADRTGTESDTYNHA